MGFISVLLNDDCFDILERFDLWANTTDDKTMALLWRPDLSGSPHTRKDILLVPRDIDPAELERRLLATGEKPVDTIH